MDSPEDVSAQAKDGNDARRNLGLTIMMSPSGPITGMP